MRAKADMISSSVCSKLIEKNADGIVLVNQRGSVLFANPAAEALFGLPLVGREFGFPVVVGEATEVDLLPPGQAPRVAELRVATISLEKQESAFLVSLRDLTERVEMEGQLRRAMEDAQEAARAKSHFLSHLSHELRTPLNAVIGLTNLLLDKCLGPVNEDQENLLRDVLQGGRELLHIFNNLLELVNAEGSRDESHVALFELRPLLINHLAKIQDQARKKNITLCIDFEKAPECVLSSEQIIGLVLDELLLNALKFTRPGGEVRLSARPLEEDSNTKLEIVVSDNGVGVQQKNLERIFEPFSQEDSSYHRTFGGLGLGLAVIRKLVGKLGGWIRAENLGQNNGSLFRIVIPI